MSGSSTIPKVFPIFTKKRIKIPKEGHSLSMEHCLWCSAPVYFIFLPRSYIINSYKIQLLYKISASTSLYSDHIGGGYHFDTIKRPLQLFSHHSKQNLGYSQISLFLLISRLPCMFICIKSGSPNLSLGTGQTNIGVRSLHSKST